MTQSSEDSIKIAILKSPEAFGLTDEDVNPILRFILKKDESLETDPDRIFDECIEYCEITINDKTHQVLYGQNGKSDFPEKPHKPIGKTKSKGHASGKSEKSDSQDGEPKISIKQLRYIGYLKYQLGDKPDYDQIGALTQKQATMLIKDLEKERAK